MGKAQGAAGAVDSDYSGRPLRRPTAEEVASAPVDSTPGNYVGDVLPDGTLLFEGPDGRLYYRHFDRNHNPIWDRPIDPELAKAIGWKIH